MQIRKEGRLYRFAYWGVSPHNRPEETSLCQFGWRFIGSFFAMLLFSTIAIIVMAICGFIIYDHGILNSLKDVGQLILVCIIIVLALAVLAFARFGLELLAETTRDKFATSAQSSEVVEFAQFIRQYARALKNKVCPRVDFV